MSATEDSLSEDQLVTFVHLFGASHLAQEVENLPAVQEMQVQSLGWEDPLEKKIITHSSNLVWKIL